MISEEELVVTVEEPKKQPGFWELFFTYQREPAYKAWKDARKQSLCNCLLAGVERLCGGGFFLWAVLKQPLAPRS